MTNQDYMKRALELAKKAMGYTSPNPMVGCVVVKDIPDNVIVRQNTELVIEEIRR